MPDKVTIQFTGPFSLPGAPDAPSVFDVEVRRECGIYLFTVQQSEGFPRHSRLFSEKLTCTFFCPNGNLSHGNQCQGTLRELTESSLTRGST